MDFPLLMCSPCPAHLGDDVRLSLGAAIEQRRRTCAGSLAHPRPFNGANTIGRSRLMIGANCRHIAAPIEGDGHEVSRRA